MSDERYKPIRCRICKENEVNFDELVKHCDCVCKDCRTKLEAEKKADKFRDDILKTEYSNRFDEIRKNMIIQSYYKYGEARKNFGQEYVDALGCIDMCLKKFRETKNTEYLADVANYAMFRFMFPKKGETFHYTDSDGSAGIDGMSVKEIERFKEDNGY